MSMTNCSDIVRYHECYTQMEIFINIHIAGGSCFTPIYIFTNVDRNRKISLHASKQLYSVDRSAPTGLCIFKRTRWRTTILSEVSRLTPMMIKSLTQNFQ